jgi:hypothetical protein
VASQNPLRAVFQIRRNELLLAVRYTGREFARRTEE